MSSFEELLLSDPGAAAKLVEKLSHSVVVPHEGGQREVLEHPARYKVLNAGRRYGKTKVGVKAMVNEAMKPSAPGQKNRLIWWIAPTYRVVKRGYAETLRQLPRQLLEHDPPPATNFDAGRSVTLRLKNGNNIEFYSAERPGGMLGEGVNYVVVDEAATIPSTVWEQVVRPTLLDTKGGGMLISTPRGRNWFYKRWQAGQRGGEWKSWTFTSYDNPHVENSEIESMKAELPSLIFAQEVMAKFVADGSNVFMWDESQIQQNMVLDNGLVEDCRPTGQVFLGIDLAKTTDYTVLYGTNESNNLNVFYDRFNGLRWSEQRRRIRRAVNLLEKQGAESVTLVMDATGVGDPIVEEMEDDGYDVIGVNFTSTKDKMVSRLAKDLETGRCLLLDRDLDEFEDYQMGQTPKGRIQYSAPEGGHDDVVSAKMLAHWGITAEGSPNVAVVGATGDPFSAVARYAEDRRKEMGVTTEDDEDQPHNDWSDLIDGSPGDDFVRYDPSVSATDPQDHYRGRQPTPEELLNNPDAWD